MKSFLILIVSCTLILAAQEKYSIQVLSVEDNASITQDFIQKVKQTGMPYTQMNSEDSKRIYIGEFTSLEEANKALADIQGEVSKDAFVCKAEGFTEIVMKPKQKMQHAMLMAKAQSLKVVKKDESKIEAKELNSLEPVEAKGSVQKIVMTKVDSRGVAPIEEVKTEEPLSKEPSQSLVCKSTKSSLREHEISRALNFYKNSSYYHFAGDKSGF